MGFRTVIITKNCKCSYKNDYLVVRGESLKMIHLSEINTVIFDTTAVAVTSYLMCEMMKWKINLVICDEKHNPIGELLPLYANYHSPKNIFKQINWTEERTGMTWTEIVYKKIQNQSMILKMNNNDNFKKLDKYLTQIEFNDLSNREGHAAKVYFNSLFGKDFSRSKDNAINAALDYGYSLLLSAVNKEIVSSGYITQLGIFHKNEYNMFNLSCDIMEPLRVFIDEIVINNSPFEFDSEMRELLLMVFEKRVRIDGSEYYLSSALPIYIQSVLKFLSEGKSERIKFIDLL